MQRMNIWRAVILGSLGTVGYAHADLSISSSMENCSDGWTAWMTFWVDNDDGWDRTNTVTLVVQENFATRDTDTDAFDRQNDQLSNDRWGGELEAVDPTVKQAEYCYELSGRILHQSNNPAVFVPMEGDDCEWYTPPGGPPN